MPDVSPTGFPEGVCIAFVDASLTETPTWYRIDDPDGDGVTAFNIVSQWSTDRGRSQEMDKSKTGTATISITDRNGILDPTNSSSPIFDLGFGAAIDPMKQVSIALKNPLTGVWQSRFRGFIDDIELELDEAENVLRGTISCVDAFAVLARTEVVPDGGGAAGSDGLSTGSGGTGTRVLVPTDTAGDVFYEDGAVDDRIRAALADGGWPSGRTAIFSGNVHVQETVYPVRSTILQILQDAADAEFPGVANVYVDNLGRVVFHGRLARFDPAGVAAGASPGAWGYHNWKAGDKSAWDPATTDSSHAAIKTITFNRGMNNLINVALASPQNILPADVAGQVSTDTGSIATYGVNSASWENLLTKDGETDGNNADQETKLFSDFYKDNYAAPRTRISTIVFTNLRSGHPAEDAHWAFLTTVEIADTMDVLTNHPGGGGFNEPFFVEGVRYTVTPLGMDNQHFITLEVDVSPNSYFSSNPFM